MVGGASASIGARAGGVGADGWAQRHPRAAQAETAFRRQRRAIRKDFGRSDVTAGTPETRFHASRTRQGSLARMFVAGDLSADELAWAVEIAGVAERIGGEVRLRTMSVETRVDTSRTHDAFFESLGAVRREVAYGRWRASLDRLGMSGKAVVLEMIVEDAGLSVAAKRWGMRNARAKQLLGHALGLWPAFISAAVREIDAADVVAAHAGLI
jgi:hypothetical protein